MKTMTPEESSGVIIKLWIAVVVLFGIAVVDGAEIAQLNNRVAVLEARK